MVASPAKVAWFALSLAFRPGSSASNWAPISGEPQHVVPAVGDGLVDRRDPVLLERLADLLEVVERLRDAEVVLREQVLVVDHRPSSWPRRRPRPRRRRACRRAIDWSGDDADRAGLTHDSPVRSTALLARVVLELHVRLPGLAEEEVDALAGVQLGLEDVEVLGGRDDLEVEVDAGLLLEPPGEDLL